MAGVQSALMSLGSSALASVAIQSVTVETQFSPAFTYTPGASGEAPASGGIFSGLNPLKILKPKFTITLANGSPVVVAPYGEPTGNYLPYALGAGAALVAGLALWRGAKVVAKGAGIAALVLGAAGYFQGKPGEASS